MIKFLAALWHLAQSFEAALASNVERHVSLFAVALLGIAFGVAAFHVGRNTGRAEAVEMDATERKAEQSRGYVRALDDHADQLVVRYSPTPRIEHGTAGHVCSQTCWKTGGAVMIAREAP